MAASARIHACWPCARCWQQWQPARHVSKTRRGQSKTSSSAPRPPFRFFPFFFSRIQASPLLWSLLGWAQDMPVRRAWPGQITRHAASDGQHTAGEGSVSERRVLACEQAGTVHAAALPRSNNSRLDPAKARPSAAPIQAKNALGSASPAANGAAAQNNSQTPRAKFSRSRALDRARSLLRRLFCCWLLLLAAAGCHHPRRDCQPSGGLPPRQSATCASNAGTQARCASDSGRTAASPHTCSPSAALHAAPRLVQSRHGLQLPGGASYCPMEGVSMHGPMFVSWWKIFRSPAMIPAKK